MSTQDAPLLTAKQFERLYLNLTSVELMMYGQAIKALADGRTACVERRTEDEHRDAFERDLELSGIDWTLMGRDAAGEYRDVRIMHRWGSWLACARAMGAVR